MLLSVSSVIEFASRSYSKNYMLVELGIILIIIGVVKFCVSLYMKNREDD